MANACHLNHGRRHFERLDATPLNDGLRATGDNDRTAVAGYLHVGALTLERDKPAAVPEQGSAPRPQATQRCDRPRDNYIGTREPLLDGRLFCSTTHDGRGQRKSIYDLIEPRDSAGHWLQKDDIQVWSHQTQRHTGQAGTRTEINHGHAGGDLLGDDGRVQEVPLPKPLDLTRPNEASFNADGGEQFSELHRRRQSVAENGWSTLRMFHVKQRAPSGLLEHHDATSWVLALALAVYALEGRHRVVHYLSLERRHWLKANPFTVRQYALRRRVT